MEENSQQVEIRSKFNYNHALSFITYFYLFIELLYFFIKNYSQKIEKPYSIIHEFYNMLFLIEFSIFLYFFMFSGFFLVINFFIDKFNLGNKIKVFIIIFPAIIVLISFFFNFLNFLSLNLDFLSLENLITIKPIIFYFLFILYSYFYVYLNFIFKDKQILKKYFFEKFGIVFITLITLILILFCIEVIFKGSLSNIFIFSLIYPFSASLYFFLKFLNFDIVIYINKKQKEMYKKYKH